MGQASRLKNYSGGRLIPTSEIQDQRLRTALELWHIKRQARNYPSRSEMTPRAMASFLRNVTLWRTAKDGTDYEYRIMGDADVAAYGRNMIGHYVSDLDELRPGNGALVKSVLDYTVRKAKPIVSAGWFVTSHERPIYHEMIFLPLGPNDTTIDHILGVSARSIG